jgi:hypothetical protein
MKKTMRVLAGLAVLAFLHQATLASDHEIAFTGYPGDEGPYGFWVVRPDGSGATLVCDSEGGEKEWSPDGQHFVYTVGVSNDHTVYRIDLADAPDACANPFVVAAPSGTFQFSGTPHPDLLFLQGVPYGPPIAIANLVHWCAVRDEVLVKVGAYVDGTFYHVLAFADPWTENQTTLEPVYATAADYGMEDFTYSPDCARVAVAQAPYPNPDEIPFAVRIVNLDTLAVEAEWTSEEIGLPISRFASMDWARTEPDRALIAYMTLYEVKKNSRRWFVTLTDFSDPSPTAEPIAEGRTPSWSPDDSKIVFSSTVDNHNHPTSTKVATIDLATREVTNLGPWCNRWSCWVDWRRAYAQPCSDDAECDDGNDCTLAQCLDGSCTHSDLPDYVTLCSGGRCCGGECIDLCESDVDCPTGASCQAAGTCEAICEFACLAAGEPCSSGEECCSGRCHPVQGVCK